MLLDHSCPQCVWHAFHLLFLAAADVHNLGPKTSALSCVIILLWLRSTLLAHQLATHYRTIRYYPLIHSCVRASTAYQIPQIPAIDKTQMALTSSGNFKTCVFESCGILVLARLKNCSASFINSSISSNDFHKLVFSRFSWNDRNRYTCPYEHSFMKIAPNISN